MFRLNIVSEMIEAKDAIDRIARMLTKGFEIVLASCCMVWEGVCI